MTGLEAKIYRNSREDIIKVKAIVRPHNAENTETEIVPGLRVKIVPLNKNKKKNRDRIGTVTGFTEQYESVRIKVQFDDTKGIGKILPWELVII